MNSATTAAWPRGIWYAAAALIPLAAASAGLAQFSGSFVAEPSGHAAARGMQIARADAASPQTKFWVRFADKGYSSAETEAAAVAELAATADSRQVHRRQLRRTDPGLFDARDLPVHAAYVVAVEQTGARVHVQSRWLNSVSVRATAAQAAAIAQLPSVVSVGPVRGGNRCVEEIGEERVIGADDMHRADGQGALRGPPPIQGLAFDQLAQSGITTLHDMGFTGAGVIVGILDTGFRRTHDVFNYPGHGLDVIAEYDFVNNDGQTANQPGDDTNQHNHGTYILSQIGAYNPGVFCGGAYDASFVLAKTEDLVNEAPFEEDNYVAGIEFVEMHGADLMTASLGYIDWYTQADLDGATAVTTIAVNIATANGLICLAPAGNQGNDTDPATSRLIAPADAPMAITVGAVSASGASAGFTSDGPTADGRVKPEVMARGVENVCCRAGNNTDYTLVSGTSLSTPVLAAAVACLVQAHPTWTVAQMRDYLIASADGFIATGTHDPQFIRGYGMVNAAAGMPDCDHNGVRDDVDIAAGAADCNSNGVPDLCEAPCAADFDGVDCVGVPDIFAFLSAWFALDASADVDESGAIAVPDIFAFLSVWFASCP